MPYVIWKYTFGNTIIKILCYKTAKNIYLFILITFVGMSFLRQALTMLKLLITFSTSAMLFFFKI